MVVAPFCTFTTLLTWVKLLPALEKSIAPVTVIVSPAAVATKRPLTVRPVVL